jgi:hypothetical protein
VDQASKLPLPNRGIQPPPEFLTLPKADLHSHSEAAPWHDLIRAARREAARVQVHGANSTTNPFDL